MKTKSEPTPEEIELEQLRARLRDQCNGEHRDTTKKFLAIRDKVKKIKVKQEGKRCKA